MYSNQKLYNLKRTHDGDVIYKRVFGTSLQEVISRTENLHYSVASITKFRPGEESILPIVNAELKQILK